MVEKRRYIEPFLLEDIVESANGNPILVAYWYKHDLERIELLLKKLKVDYSKIGSAESIEKWNKGEIAVGKGR